jgi:hypothetical protein
METFEFDWSLHKMKEIADKFTTIIAFWLPGALLLWVLSYPVPTIAGWFAKSTDGTPTVGGFLFVSLASLVLGVIVNAIRWNLLDRGIFRDLDNLKPTHEQYSKLKDDTNRLAAFQALVDNNYRWYQSYANTAIAIAAGCLIYVIVTKWSWTVVIISQSFCFVSYYQRPATNLTFSIDAQSSYWKMEELRDERLAIGHRR